MRSAFISTLIELAESDPRIILLTSDLGFNVLEPFLVKFPDRFFNIGVAEQNMLGVATGLAEAGFIPFVYSIVPFAVLRPYEFIRNGPILHRFPVRIVSIGGGLEYGHDGISHYGLEDVGVMRIQPGISVIVPADHKQACSAIRTTWNLPYPVYYRLGKDDQTVVPGLEGRFKLGRIQIINKGTDILFISMGSISIEVATAIKTLANHGVSCMMIIVASINPAPIDDLAELLKHFGIAITVEVHYLVGGLGSLVSEVIAEQGLCCRVVRCGISHTPDGISGSHRYMLHLHGLSSDKLVATALHALQGE